MIGKKKKRGFVFLQERRKKGVMKRGARAKGRIFSENPQVKKKDFVLPGQKSEWVHNGRKSGLFRRERWGAGVG